MPTNGAVGLAVALLVLGSLAAHATDEPAGAGLVRHGPRDERRVALTFDADMTPAMRQQVLAGTATHYDRRIIRLLRDTDTPATIFFTGLWVETYPRAARSIATDPLFEAANHSQDHRAFRLPCFGLAGVTTDAGRAAEIRHAAREIHDATGVAPRLFRFPGGCHDPSDVALVRSFGEVPVQWDVVSGDAFQHDAHVIVHRVLSNVQAGSIVVFHLVGAPNAPATYRALQRIIPRLVDRGYELVTVSELLAG